MPNLVTDPATYTLLPGDLTLREAAAAVDMTANTLRKAIKDGDLEAYIPRGRDPLRAGRGQGYRITKANLQRWYFGQQKEVSQ